MKQLMCIQCSMRAMVDDLPLPTFNETVEQHMNRLHTDLATVFHERMELERRLEAKLKKERGGDETTV